MHTYWCIESKRDSCVQHTLGSAAAWPPPPPLLVYPFFWLQCGNVLLPAGEWLTIKLKTTSLSCKLGRGSALWFCCNAEVCSDNMRHKPSRLQLPAKLSGLAADALLRIGNIHAAEASSHSSKPLRAHSRGCPAPGLGLALQPRQTQWREHVRAQRCTPVPRSNTLVLNTLAGRNSGRAKAGQQRRCPPNSQMYKPAGSRRRSAPAREPWRNVEEGVVSRVEGRRCVGWDEAILH